MRFVLVSGSASGKEEFSSPRVHNRAPGRFMSATSNAIGDCLVECGLKAQLVEMGIWRANLNLV